MNKLSLSSTGSPVLMSLRGVALTLGVSEATVRRMVADHELPIVRVRRRVMVPASALRELADGVSGPTSEDLS